MVRFFAAHFQIKTSSVCQITTIMAIQNDKVLIVIIKKYCKGEKMKNVMPLPFRIINFRNNIQLNYGFIVNITGISDTPK